MGIRQSFGIFLTPLAVDLEIGRQAFGLAVAGQNLVWGFVQPFVGAVADRWGALRVTVVGSLLYAAGLVLTTFTTGPGGLTFTFGALIGLAFTGTTYVTVLGAVGRVAPPERRSVAFGICTAAGSFGMFAVVPGAQALLDAFGWRNAFVVLAIAVSLLVPLTWGFRPSDRLLADSPKGQTVGAAIREASVHGGFWLLVAGFFVCGFQIAFIATHLPAFLGDNGLPGTVNAWALAMVGLFNVLGCYLAGLLGQRYRQKHLLAAVYALRGAVIGLFLALPLTAGSAIAFGVAIGFLWHGTLPPTSGAVARIFGTQHLSMLYDVVFASHQLGAFFGAWGAGYAYDVLSSYDSMWIASILLSVFATVIHLQIDDRPLARLQAASS